ncbi:hypothetical protein [Agriterribacter sp.]|uniref:hypothetical protein n=1 Tax=Agriterribacter sp. TaxID=2821509 RepID=UPI002C5451FB|nr:hypothetical protein [Agriterribacter sp.]HRP56990.1 hypothetical protein [Agriterribacter sp.]
MLHSSFEACVQQQAKAFSDWARSMPSVIKYQFNAPRNGFECATVPFFLPLKDNHLIFQGHQDPVW